jgi:hypothetical protein
VAGRDSSQRNLGNGPGFCGDNTAARECFLAVPAEELYFHHGIGRTRDGDGQRRAGVAEAALAGDGGYPAGVLDVHAGHDLPRGWSRPRANEVDAAGRQSPQDTLLDDRGHGTACAPDMDGELRFTGGQARQDD